jgi:hypothetical protein
LASREAKSYDACPYCLTEITLEEAPAITKEERKPETNETIIKEPDMRPTKEKSAKAQSKVQGCAHYFGYLSKRPTKEKIPEECVICENIVKCMLQNVTS